MEANLKTITSSEKVANGKATLLRKQPFFGVTSFKLIIESHSLKLIIKNFFKSSY